MSKVKDYWEDKHINSEQLWLTGSHIDELKQYMNISNYLKIGNKLLNIGVGMGYCTTEFVNEGLLVDVLDISEKALENVKNITQKQFLTSDMENLPKRKYDLVISHLVCQHINDKELTNQISSILPTLKKDGVLALQFAFVEDTDYKNRHKQIQSIDSQMGGGVIRPLSRIEDIVNKCGGTICWTSDVRNFEHTITKWQYVHIKK